MARKKQSKITLSIDPETKERLAAYAEIHRTSISHAVTEWIWKQKIPKDHIRGQMSLEK